MLRLLFFLVLVFNCHSLTLVKRSIDLIATHRLTTGNKLSNDIAPNSYELQIQPLADGYFEGLVKINISFLQTSKPIITLHSHKDLKFSEVYCNITHWSGRDQQYPLTVILPSSIDKHEKSETVDINFDIPDFKKGSQCDLTIVYTGTLYSDTSEGLFRSSYIDPLTNEEKWFVASHSRPNLARRIFPCFDEPSFKVPFIIKIGRPVHMSSMSNMPLKRTYPMEESESSVWDEFEQTPPMSTFTVGIVVSEFQTISYDDALVVHESSESKPHIRIWGRPDFLEALRNVSEKIDSSLEILEEFFDLPYPLPKLDIVALPNYQATRPADNWGLILFKESELSGKGSWHISQELAYQWLGAYITPTWWSEARVNTALVRYVTAYTTLKMYNGKETFNNWPMTTLYSIYYEFSKRYPHGKSTAIKQDSGAAKTELVFRMLNYTLGEGTFKRGIQRFVREKQFQTFNDHDIWNSLTQQAWLENTLDKSVTVNEIACSWNSKDRLPVVNVTRDYNSETAIIRQRVYLRERPHDVPDQEKLLWWIPIVLVKGCHLDFKNSTPMVWMKETVTIKLDGMPKSDKFIIVNPEEIGPFPVNYDAKNWNMLANFLNSDRRTEIPVNTRAKLLHDAWNLAYAGDLGFATALNLTLFLKRERDNLAWDPVFTMIDHIGRHIDSSKVHNKFQTYVRILLTPLYEELGNEPEEGESDGRAHLRSSSKVFLCQAGYAPCIEEAQQAFKKWMEIEDPDEGNPVPNQYICPVFKWGTKEEWEFGLERVMKFPENRKQNERTYLLKTLAGCPVDSWKIEKLLTITVLEANGNFTDNDVYLIFSMLTGSANGYTTLFHFLEKNWDNIKNVLEDKPFLWNGLLTSATTPFKTQEGLDMVRKLYREKRGNFGTGEFIVERALRIIKEETKWSNDNLPVIEAWLDNYLKENKAEIIAKS